MKISMAMILLLIFQWAEASVVRFSGSDPDIKKFEKELNDLFPDHYSQVLEEPIRIHFERLDSSSRLENPCQVTRKRVMGRTKFALFTGRPDVYIHSGFLPYIKKGDKVSIEFDCGHKNFYKTALASVIHEVSHVYDRSEKQWSQSDRANQQACQITYPSEPISMLDFNCKYYLKAQGKISGSPNYYNLLQFPDDLRSNKNKLIRRSVDPYELVNAEEHFAVNMEYFLLDSQYQCRRPSLYAHFSSITGFRPFPNMGCQSAKFVLGSVTMKKMLMDPARVYSVHYLFASKGQRMMSKWGHSMFRVIMCAPHRAQVGPDCLMDVSYHIVFSYRAHIADMIIDYWQGLTGKYPSQLLAYSMAEMVEEYNRDEGRDLFSLPLNLTELEKNIMVGRLLEQFWSYSGKYYFLTNNCAHETDQILRGALHRGHPYQDTANMTPLGIYRMAELHKLTDISVLRDKEQSVAEGYFFPSQKERLEEAYRGLRKYLQQSTLDSYLANSQAVEREKVLKRLPEKKMAANLYILEKQILRRLQGGLDEAVVKTVQGQEKAGRQSKISDLVNKSLSMKQKLLPWSISSGGYGVPLDSEVMTDEARQAAVIQYLDVLLESREESYRLYPQIAIEIDKTRQNLQTFFEYIKASESGDSIITALACNGDECPIP